MKKILLAACLFLTTLTLTGCYQVHSDDDLRTIPVTNNPNIVPQRSGGPMTAAAPSI